MHIVNSCANDIQCTENKCNKSADYQLDRFLSASTLSSLSFPVISAESTVC